LITEKICIHPFNMSVGFEDECIYFIVVLEVVYEEVSQGIRKITSSLRAPTVDPGYPGAVRKLRASGHPGVPPGTGSFF
jgi:hypothetical protein